MNLRTARFTLDDVVESTDSDPIRFFQDRPLLAILTLAFALRLLWALFIAVVPVSDSAAYLALAKSLAEGRGYAWADGTLTAFWPPGTSFLYGGLFWLFGQRFEPIVALNLMAGVAVVYLGFRITRLLYGRPVALLAAALLAVWPLLIQFTTILASEILFLVPVLMATLVVFETRSPKPWHFIGFGFLVAVASYIRPTATPLLVILPVLCLLRVPSWRHLAGWVGVGGLVCMLAIWPWTERNSRLFGQPTSLSTNFGANLWMGNNSRSQGTYQTFEEYIHLPNEKLRDDQMRKDAIDFIVDNPVEFLKLGVKRLVVTFDRETIGVVWNIHGIEARFENTPWVASALKLVSTGYWYVVLLAGLAGGVLMVRRERWRVIGNPVIVVSLFFAAVPAVMVGQDRYHVPMIPLIACCAAYSLHHVLMRRRSARAAA